MMIAAANLRRDLDQVGQREIAAVVWRNPEAVPRRSPVGQNLTCLNGLLEELESITHSRTELIGADCAKLSLGIMEIIDVDGLESEIGSARLDHCFQIARRNAVSTLHQIARLNDAWPQQVFLKPGARIARHFAIKGDIAALGCDYHFLAFDLAVAH